MPVRRWAGLPMLYHCVDFGQMRDLTRDLAVAYGVSLPRNSASVEPGSSASVEPGSSASVEPGSSVSVAPRTARLPRMEPWTAPHVLETARPQLGRCRCRLGMRSGSERLPLGTGQGGGEWDSKGESGNLRRSRAVASPSTLEHPS